MNEADLARGDAKPAEGRRWGDWIGADLFRLIAAASTSGFALSSFYLLPKFLDRELHAGPAKIGLVTGIFGVATVVLAPVVGRWSDRVPHRDAMFTGALLLAASSAGFLAVDSVGPLVLALRVVQALANVLLFVAIGAATAELAPPERLSQALGLTGASMLVMNAIAPAVAEPLADAAGWPAVFVLAAAAALVSALLARRVREPASRHARDRNLRSGLFQVLARPLVAHYACVVLLAGMTFGTVVTFEPPFALAHGREQVRGFYVAFAGSAILVRIFLGHAPDRFGRHLVAGLSLALYAASASGLALAPSSLLEVIGAIFGIAHGLFYPALNAIALASVSAHERGRVMAIFTAAFNLGVGATVFLGVAAEHVGYAPVFHVAGAAALAAAIVVATSRELRVAGAREPRSTSR